MEIIHFKKVLLANIKDITSYGVKNILQSNFNVLGIDLNAEKEFKKCLFGLDQEYDLVIMGIQNDFENTAILELLTQKQIKQHHKILFLVDNYNDANAIFFLKAGAIGYLNININSEEFLTAIKRICTGNTYLLDSQVKLLVKFVGNEKMNAEDNLFSTLSTNEYKIMKLLLKGLRLKDIANSLDLAVTTIGTYKTRIFRKLNISNTIELVRLIDEHNILLED